MPDWFVYNLLLSVVYFVFYHVFSYRVGVVRMNLRNSFPEKNSEELKGIEKRFYKHLSEVMLDSIVFSGLSRKKAMKRIVFDNLDETMQKIDNKSWIAALAHYGSWEYFSAFPLWTPKEVVGVYRPLHSEAFDMYYNKMRSRFGLVPVPMSDLMRYIVRHRESPRGFVLGLIADQTPPWGGIDYWYNFLNQKTPFFPGIDKTARKFHLPVIFVGLRKVSKAHYIAHMDVIYDGVERVPEHEITKRYVRKLEEMIVAAPEYWMWSHKRWKHKPPGPDAPGMHDDD